MRRFTSAMLTLLSASALAAVPGVAMAASGQVTVFESEATEVVVFNNPNGCNKLPLLAHVLVNHTDRPLVLHTDPLCITPGTTVAPGYGSHVAPVSGSFSI